MFNYPSHFVLFNLSVSPLCTFYFFISNAVLFVPTDAVSLLRFSFSQHIHSHIENRGVYIYIYRYMNPKDGLFKPVLDIHKIHRSKKRASALVNFSPNTWTILIYIYFSSFHLFYLLLLYSVIFFSIYFPFN